MTSPEDLHVVQIEQLDERLGRQVVHDPASRNYEFERPRGFITPDSFRLNTYNPAPNPRQKIGNCTGCDQCIKCNTKGNRVRGVRLDMDTALKIYSRATQLDPWPGSYPPADTGSSGLAAAKAAKEYNLIDRYEWIFSGTDTIIAALQAGKAVGVGTYWENNMFDPDPETLLVEPGGGLAGGHQWPVIGWSKKFRAFEGLCWWGDDFGRLGMFRIKAEHLAALLAQDGDAHITYRRGANA
jgi:hypothetical protein